MNPNLNTTTESIIGCAYTVANTLGHGSIEKIYENALNHELSKGGIHLTQVSTRCSVDRLAAETLVVGHSSGCCGC